MSGECHDEVRSLDEALAELERTDPAVAAAAESLERAKQNIIEGRTPSRWKARRMRDGLLHYGWMVGPFMPLHASNCWCRQERRRG